MTGAHDPVAELDALLAAGRAHGFDWTDAHRCVDLLDFVPGRTAVVARALDDALDASSLDALWRLPPDVPGVLEGAHRGIRRGLSRPWPMRGSERPVEGLAMRFAPRRLAIDFPASRARHFPATLARAHESLGAGATPLDAPLRTRLEALEVGRKRHYRACVDLSPQTTLSDQKGDVAVEFEQLRGNLARLKGVRLWINGWQVGARVPVPDRARALLVAAWFEALR